jgi:hypothetical protein
MSDYLGSILLNSVARSLVLAAENKRNILLTEEDPIIRELGTKLSNVAIPENQELRIEMITYVIGKWLKNKTINDLDRLCLYFNMELNISIRR